MIYFEGQKISRYLAGVSFEKEIQCSLFEFQGTGNTLKYSLEKNRDQMKYSNRDSLYTVKCLKVRLLQ